MLGESKTSWSDFRKCDIRRNLDKLNPQKAKEYREILRNRNPKCYEDYLEWEHDLGYDSE